jgi:ComF family protein
MDLFFPTLLRGWLAPPACLACDALMKEDRFLCGSCEEAIEDLGSNHCRYCAEPFAGNASSSHRCARCIKTRPPFRQAWASLLYRGPLVELMHGVKFGKNPLGLKILIHRALPEFRRAIIEFDPEEILPVPLSPWRRFSRGFNQSYLLAHYLLRYNRRKIPLRRWATRSHARAQAQQSRSERMNILKTAFSVPRPTRVRGKRILIVDDVMTTGATVEALSHCLLKAGAKEVGVYVLARTPKN